MMAASAPILHVPLFIQYGVYGLRQTREAERILLSTLFIQEGRGQCEEIQNIITSLSMSSPRYVKGLGQVFFPTQPPLPVVIWEEVQPFRHSTPTPSKRSAGHPQPLRKNPWISSVRPICFEYLPRIGPQIASNSIYCIFIKNERRSVLISKLLPNLRSKVNKIGKTAPRKRFWTRRPHPHNAAGHNIPPQCPLPQITTDLHHHPSPSTPPSPSITWYLDWCGVRIGVFRGPYCSKDPKTKPQMIFFHKNLAPHPSPPASGDHPRHRGGPKRPSARCFVYLPSKTSMPLKISSF